MVKDTDSTDNTIGDKRQTADELDAMKSDFLAVMSHEIRTPMQSIYGLLELLSDEKMGEDAVKMVHTAKDSASGLLELLDNVLDLAKINAGKMEIEKLEVPLRTLVYGVLECLDVQKGGKNITLAAEIDDNLPAVVTGDPLRLRQVLLNLTGNAVKFTQKGGVTVAVTSRADEKSGKDGDLVLRFEIRDTGPGMTEETATKLFSPFTQADASTTRRYGGTGLGLSISSRLVEMMGGTIGVESRAGEGSVFRFEIPAQTVSADRYLTLPDLAGLAVLSVEDHPAGAREIKSSLESMGAKIESCGTYKEGLELLRRRPFDVAVIDHGLPDGLGIELAQQAADIRPFTGIVIYTVRDDLGLRHSARALGATYLTKPASRRGLGEAVRAAARSAAPLLSTRSRRVLVAEDNETVRDVLRRQLEKLGVAADFVENGIAALDRLDETEYGMLLTDLHMPDMDGYTLVARLRDAEENANVPPAERFPVAALTADVHLARRQAYLSRGFDEALLKPVTLGQLRRLLMRWGILDAEPDTEAAKEKPEGNGQKVQFAAVDYACIDAQLGGVEALPDILAIFVEMTAPLLAEMCRDFEKGNLRGLQDGAHNLKGGALSACCTALGDAAGKIEAQLAAGGKIMAEDMDDLVRAFAAVEDDLQKLRRNQG